MSSSPRMRTMETRFTKEALLRHLLDTEDSMPDEKTVYSFLLGYRIFQSPDQLLSEIKRRANTNDSAENRKLFQRREGASNARSFGPVCTKCRQKHEDPRKISKSTNNMLDKDTSSLYVELVRNNHLVQETGKMNIPAKEGELSPALSSNEITCSPVKASDFDDYCDIDVFENRRNTVPEHKLNAAVSNGTDFGTSKSVIEISPNDIELKLEITTESNSEEVLCADGVVASGEDTIRRRRKGRRRTTATSPEPELANLTLLSEKPTTSANKLAVESNVTDRRSVASRDSGILSGLIEGELEEFQTNNNNNNKKNKSNSNNSTSSEPRRVESSLYRGIAHSEQKSPNDSGYSSQVSPASLSETMETVSKDIEAHVCSKVEENSHDPYARQRHLLHVLLVWVRDFPSDFKKNKTLVSLEGLINSLKTDCQELRTHCDQVLETLQGCTATQNKYEASLRDSENKDALKRAEDFRTTKENMIAMVTGMSDAGDANKMAEQLCLIEMDLLSHLGAEEFLQMFNSSGDDKSRTNLGACVRWFNHLSHLVATTVCLCRKPKHRRHVISLFARSAARCYQLSNFNSAMAILTGLSLGAVARLKRTWNKVETEQIEKLQMVFDPSNNFRRYRTMFNERWAALRHQQQEDNDVKLPAPNTNRYSTASQHSVTSRLSVASLTSQHRDSGIECENDSGASAKSTMTSAATASPKKQFTFDVTSLTGIQDGVLVPFLTLMVKDVYFLNHATPTIESDGTINFEKLRHLGEILRPLETWKQNPCVYEKNEVLQDFLLHSPVLKDSELYSLSYKREPPKNKFEKSQLKTIRAEMETSKRNNAIKKIIARRKTM